MNIKARIKNFTLLTNQNVSIVLTMTVIDILSLSLPCYLNSPCVSVLFMLPRQRENFIKNGHYQDKHKTI